MQLKSNPSLYLDNFDIFYLTYPFHLCIISVTDISLTDIKIIINFSTRRTNFRLQKTINSLELEREKIMVRVFKWTGLSVLGVVLLALLTIFITSSVRLDRDYYNFDVAVENITIPSDPDSIARGEHVAVTRYCDNCHGEDLAGSYLINDPALAVIPVPNLTSGDGGIGKTNSDQDWIRAIRHGVGHDGRGLIAMPSRYLYYLSDDDLGDLIAYLKSIPPVDNTLPKRSFGPMFRLLVTLGQAPPAEVNEIDHSAVRPVPPPAGETVAYGEYLANICQPCHGDDLNGGTIRDFDGELITSLNITPGGGISAWDEAGFIEALRTGVTPLGREITDMMPWSNIGQLTDVELKAIWLYLKSLPALEQGFERTDL